MHHSFVLVFPLFGAGIFAHLGYFIRGDHCVKGPSYISAAITFPTILALLLVFHQNFTWLEAIRTVITGSGAFMTGLTSSILTYRLYFHPLKRFPGPVGARLTKIWHVKRNFQGEMTFALLDRLHAKYGDFVRIGPNELSIIDSDIIDACFGPRSTCGKTEWYASGMPMTTVHQMRDRAMHDRRRRGGWDKAFSSKSLRAYDPRIIGFADKLIMQLDSFGGKPVNATKWFHYFGYDVMGSLGFGRSFNTLESGESHYAIDICEQGQGALQYLTGIPWILHILTRIPASLSPITKLLDYSTECVQKRRETEQDGSDIISHLLQAEKFFNDKALDHMLLTGDSRLVIIAGSDTTSAALAYSSLYLAKDPSVVGKVRAELTANGIDGKSDFSIPELQNLAYLNGVINEALRLHPPVPGGVFRTTPPAGLQVGKTYLPGNINLMTPHYTLMRSPSNFVDPNSFIPERWSTRSDLTLNKDAFLPFSAGPYGCIGKHLAYNEMRTVIAKMVMEFDIALAPGETGENLIKNARDMFTMIPGDLNLCFTRRS